MKTKHLILLICILGSLFRVAYAFKFQPWMMAPDQLAWEILLGTNKWSYSYLIHYPHEGGSLLISFLGKLVGFITPFHSLTIVALLLDLVIRFIQISIVKDIGGKSVALVFGIWTVFAISVLIPWSSVNFGLHYINSVSPFIFLWILNRKISSHQFPLIMGVFLGFAFWFHYANSILIICYLLFIVLSRGDLKHKLKPLGFASVIISFHFLIRLLFDSGFQLQKGSVVSIRGVNFNLSTQDTLQHFIDLWDGILMDIIYAGLTADFQVPYIKPIWVIALLLGIVLSLRRLKTKSNLYATTIILLFLLSYCMSPFYFKGEYLGNYVSYRHLCYIIPLMIFLSISGFFTLGPKWKFLSVVLVVIGIYSSSALYLNEPNKISAVRPIGWIIGSKIGHLPDQVKAVISNTEYSENELMIGVSWGTANAIFHSNSPLSQSEISKRRIKLYSLLTQYKPELRCETFGGVIYAFGEQVTPTLNKKAKRKVLAAEDVFLTK